MTQVEAADPVVVHQYLTSRPDHSRQQPRPAPTGENASISRHRAPREEEDRVPELATGLG